MAQSYTPFCLLLWCITLCLFHYSSCSRDKEDQYCGNDKFYCPMKSQCFDRKLRCTSSNVCTDSSGNEAKCYEGSSPGVYKYYLKKSPLSSSGSSSRKKRAVSGITHWFVEYRGFAYEFGTYGWQELDVNDPKYKYGPGREKVKSEELKGTSRCTRHQVIAFNNRWIAANPKYHLLRNNCQDFAKKLLKELQRDCPNRVRREDGDTESLEAPSECFSSASSSSFGWKPRALFASLISFAIFHTLNL